MIATALLLLVAEPAPEAFALSRDLAEAGTLSAVLPLIQAKETEELIADNPDLTTAERDRLRALAMATFRHGRERIMDATARAYAERLSIEDLRALVAVQKTEAATRYRDLMPEAIAAAMQKIGPMDYKGDVRAAFCKETGKLCDSR